MECYNLGVEKKSTLVGQFTYYIVRHKQQYIFIHCLLNFTYNMNFEFLVISIVITNT